MQRLALHPSNPQSRLIDRAAAALRAGALVVYPTDTTYGMGCDLFARRAVERIYALKGKPKDEPLSFLCSDLSELARYGMVDNRAYRILRQLVPGPYTFILKATREVPKSMLPRGGTVGLRVVRSPVCQALLHELGHPIISTTATRAPADPSSYLTDPDDIEQVLGHSVEVLLDVGPLEGAPSSVIDLTGDEPRVLRDGAGDLAKLKL